MSMDVLLMGATRKLLGAPSTLRFSPFDTAAVPVLVLLSVLFSEMVFTTGTTVLVPLVVTVPV